MTREELDELLNNLEQIGFNVVDVTAEEFNENNKDEDYEGFINDLKMKKKFEISKIDFNKACDYVVGCLDDLSFTDIVLLARFTSAVRYVLFDAVNREQKKEEK